MNNANEVLKHRIRTTEITLEATRTGLALQELILINQIAIMEKLLTIEGDMK